MLTYQEIHLLIEQGLNTLAIFAETSILHEQIDLEMEHVIVNEINEVLNIKDKDRNVIQKNIAESLSMIVRGELVKEDRYYVYTLPTSFLSLSSATLVVGSNDCFDNEPDEVTGVYKITSDKAEFKGAWYNKGDIISIKSISDKNAITSGIAKKLKTALRKITLVPLNQLESYSYSSTFGLNHPLLGNDQNKVYIYYNSKYKSTSEIPLQVIIRLSTGEFPDTKRLSWCKQQTLDLPVNIQHYFINKVIERLAIINQKDQQNIANLKTETII